MADAFIKELTQYGILGLLLAISLLVNWYQERKAEKLHEEKENLHNQITEIVKETTSVNQQLSVSLQLLTEKITKGRR